MNGLIVKECKKGLIGEINIPGDKSISHRAIMCGALANGKTVIDNILLSDDVLNTINCFRSLGVNIRISNKKVTIYGVGRYGLNRPNMDLDCGNSGTTMRLLSGILAGQNFPSRLIGDQSLSKRPMDRIITPLSQMGAIIKSRAKGYPPLEILPSKGLKGIDYRLPVASAQVKSSILWASLYGHGRTVVIENQVSRDHTERMLDYFGVKIAKKGNKIIMENGQSLEGKNLFIPGDISSAAFFIVAASIVEGSHLVIKNVGINPTRRGVLEVLEQMGGKFRILNKRLVNNEEIGDIEVKYSNLKGCTIKGDIIGSLIDELPIIAVAAAFAQGRTIIKDAYELRVKETDRIRAMVIELQKMGAVVKELKDGMIIDGVNNLRGSRINSYNDHRIAMALSIAALKAKGDSFINGYKVVDISYPEFYETLNGLYV